jgi:hypothetical protein
MGVDASALTVLAGLARAGRLKGRVLMLGRQNTFFKTRDLRRVSRAFDLGLSGSSCEEIPRQRFTEDLFRALGAADCLSVDASDYEGASLICDLNRPLNAAPQEKFDFIFDGGTTEHIYDVAQVQKNIAAMLKDGGTYVGACPANCESGHGFYQFSPEFYYRSLQAAGFHIERLYLSAAQFPAQWYSVKDPDDIGGRITFRSAEPVYALVIARKGGRKASDASPMQSDYEKGNWVSKVDHLTWDRSPQAKVLRLANRIVRLRLLWSLNVAARNLLLVGAAVWPTSRGIARVNIFEDLRQVASLEG